MTTLPVFWGCAPPNMRNKHEILREVFGYRDFRGGQERLVDAAVSGRDVLAVMPTGAGKSLCFQIPALMGDGVTIVVSPLISLMKDQVEALLQNGVRAAYINSSLTPAQIDRALANARAGVYKLVYVAPERLLTDAFLSFAGSVKLDLLAVDEAHCVSQWGQDFRPGYLDIAEFADRLPRRPVIGAYTATATAAVREDILHLLRLHDPLTVTTGFDRPNLRFEVVHAGRGKMEALTSLLGELRGQSGIVYCATRKNVEEVCAALCAHGFAATRYHAGLDEGERRRNQEDFLYDRAPLMVATNAFGMGIDKSNVSFVLHYNMPKDMESYYQEAGRAGRDGSAARCVLLYSPADVRLNQFLLEHAEPNEDISPGTRAVLREREEERLRQMTFYATSTDCLRAFILRYFGEQAPLRCENCSNCLGGAEEADVTDEARLILRCVAQSGERYGAGMIVGLLRGAEDERTARCDRTMVTTFGALRGTDAARLRELIALLCSAGFLCRTEGEYPLLMLGERSDELLCGNRRVTARLHTRAPKKAAKQAPVPSLGDLGPPDELLYETLRGLRKRLADRASIPAYAVFTNATLLELAVRRPVTEAELLEISGVGRAKCERWGKIFLQTIREHLAQQGTAAQPAKTGR